ncbi:MAG: hypothetical protein JRN12_07500 [Nitrososphaerota archaeon]|jgi:NAD(P)-dependent dehydrogenase (short-subunit alcohol dehydrogenase family)|nr:hypothetical protein [Nitrososphaerota archaeon]MDG6951669.1 hypothetical protein [Nitrososphaerota archaeon]
MRFNELLRLAGGSALATTYYALPLMFRRRGGLIVNTLWWNRGRYLWDLFFDVASAGVGRMIYGLSKETLSRIIATVAASPGWTRTERMTDVPASKLKQLRLPSTLEGQSST